MVGEARNGSEALELVRRARVDVLIMDLDMPGQSGIDVLSGIRAAAPEVAVLVYTAYPQEQFAAATFQFGARGFVSKEGDPAEIEIAIRELALGRCHITQATADLLPTVWLADRPRTAALGARVPGLSEACGRHGAGLDRTRDVSLAQDGQ